MNFNIRVFLILTVFTILVSGCVKKTDSTDEKIVDSSGMSEDFAAGTQPFNVDFFADTNLLQNKIYTIEKKRYGLSFSLPRGFKSIDVSNSENLEEYNKFDKSEFFKSRLMLFFKKTSVQDSGNIKTTSNEIIAVSEIRGYSDKVAETFWKKFSSSEKFNKFKINFSRLYMNKKYMINQYVFFPITETPEKRNPVSISFIFAPALFEHYEILFIRVPGIDDKFVSVIETFMESMKLIKPQ